MNKPVSILLIFIITLMVAFLFAAPKYQESVDLQHTLMQKQAEYDGKSAYYASVSKLIKNVQTRADALDKVNDALPSQFSFAPLIYFFQQKGAESGLATQSMAFSKIYQIPGQNMKNADVTLSLQGSYPGLKKFLLALDASARLFETHRISFASPLQNAAKNQSPMYQFELEVGVHTY